MQPAGTLNLPKIVQGIHEIIAEKRLQYTSKPKIKLKVVASRMGEGGRIHVCLAEILRMLSNLIDNSVEAIDDHGLILVLLNKNENELKISVRDNGRGIPSHILPELSRRGFTFAKAYGKGLGLHTTKKLIESYGGRLEIVSQLGRGTEVILLLPL
jgi:signal transduction histidine kinase